MSLRELINSTSLLLRAVFLLRLLHTNPTKNQMRARCSGSFIGAGALLGMKFACRQRPINHW